MPFRFLYLQRKDARHSRSIGLQLKDARLNRSISTLPTNVRLFRPITFSALMLAFTLYWPSALKSSQLSRDWDLAHARLLAPLDQLAFTAMMLALFTLLAFSKRMLAPLTILQLKDAFPIRSIGL